MASDFFERQDAARRNTAWLVVSFALAVVAMIVSIDLLLAGILGYLGRDPQTGAIDWALAADPQLLGLATVGTLLVVGGGSLFKIAQLRGGGRTVAEALGGRRINSNASDPSERQLLNVVEEMAIASGIPAPPVYLMDHEEGVNAFAAGFSPADAVIGVTRGTAQLMSRDELQGVIAHEFSHILNGDMGLNIRLMGLLNGILIIGIIGYFVLRTAAFSGYHGRRSRQEGNPLPLLAIGAGLMAVGFFGMFFGNLIKAAVSRQREFLADASAVQFTRQADGLAGALKKIGGVVAGSSIQNPNAPEASHLFFGRATSGLAGLFSTHPPLSERIRRVDPQWDGTFPAVQLAPGPVGSRQRVSRAASGAEAAGFAAGGPQSVAQMVSDVGQPTDVHIEYAGRLIAALPPALVESAHEPYGARAVVYALLLDDAMDARAAQLEHLSAAADPGVYRETRVLTPAVLTLDFQLRLPLLELTLPALRELTDDQLEVFVGNVVTLVRADNRITLFEWALQRVLLHDLERHRGRVSPPRVRHRTLAAVTRQCELLMSSLAHVGHNAPEASGAFELARESLGLHMQLLGPDRCGLDTLDVALTDLEQTAPKVKRRILQAAAVCITADQTVTHAEAELLRAVSASLDCPMPPLPL